MSLSFVAKASKSAPALIPVSRRRDPLDKLLAPARGLSGACRQLRLLLANSRPLSRSAWAAQVRLDVDRRRRNRRRLVTLADTLRQEELDEQPEVVALFTELVVRWITRAPWEFDRKLDYARLEIHWIAGRRNLAVRHRIGHAAAVAAASRQLPERVQKQLQAHAVRHAAAACEQAGQSLHTVREEQIAEAVSFALLQIANDPLPGQTRV